MLVGEIGEGEKERDRYGFGVAVADFAAEFFESGFCWGEENGAVGCDAFGNAEAEIGDGGRAVLVPVVEIGAVLAGDGEGIFESGCGDESYACAFALEQCVGSDRGAVADFDLIGRNERGDLADSFEDGAAGIGGGGGEFEDLDAAGVAVDAVGEGAAGVDGDDETGSHWRKRYQAAAEVLA